MRRKPHPAPKPPAGFKQAMEDADPRIRFGVPQTLRREYHFRRALLALKTHAPELPPLQRSELAVIGQILDVAHLIAAAESLAQMRGKHWSFRLAEAYRWLFLAQDIEAERRAVARQGAKDGPEASGRVNAAETAPDAPTGQP